MTNLLVISDAPNQPSGLARITRDILSRLGQDFPDLNITQLGYNWFDGVIPIGGDRVKPDSFISFPWRVKHIKDTQAWGTADVLDLVSAAILDGSEDKPDAIFTVYDPARIVGVAKVAKLLSIPLWAYLPIDTYNIHGAISGPAKEALESCAQVIAYGPFGAGVLKKTLNKPIAWLPHGLDAAWYRDLAAERKAELLQEARIPEAFIKDADFIIGCVATNQARKDLGLLFQSASIIANYSRDNATKKVKLWLHTDTEYGHWVIPQLALDFGWSSDLLVTTEVYSDETMRALYSLCDVTIAPGLGEGFGYPIVESLACGVPVVHGNFGGGASLIPKAEWKPTSTFERLDGSYNLVRPVFSADEFADSALEILDTDDPALQLYCRGSVFNLNWYYLWPRWRAQFRKMLETL